MDNLQSSCIVPHNGIIQRLARLAVPDERRLALIRNPNGFELRELDLRRGQRLTNARLDVAQYFVRVVFTPAWLLVYLLMLELVAGCDVAIVVKGEKAGAGGALINGSNERSLGSGCHEGEKGPYR